MIFISQKLYGTISWSVVYGFLKLKNFHWIVKMKSYKLRDGFSGTPQCRCRQSRNLTKWEKLRDIAWSLQPFLIRMVHQSQTIRNKTLKSRKKMLTLNATSSYLIVLSYYCKENIANKYNRWRLCLCSIQIFAMYILWLCDLLHHISTFDGKITIRRNSLNNCTSFLRSSLDTNEREWRFSFVSFYIV